MRGEPKYLEKCFNFLINILRFFSDILDWSIWKLYEWELRIRNRGDRV